MMQTYIMSGATSRFTTKYSPSISLDPKKKYEAALLSIDLYNSIPNITELNNAFRYTADNGQTWKTILLATGAYELSAINSEIQRKMALNGDYDKVHSQYYVNITANLTTLKSIITISNNKYKVDFSVANSIGSVLGFTNEIIVGSGSNSSGSVSYTESPNIVNIMQVNSILVNIDIIIGSYVNGFYLPTIYSFSPNVSPGYKIVERPTPSLIFYPVSRYEIDHMKVWLTDQNNNDVDIRGEVITVRICIREAAFDLEDIKAAIDELSKLKL